MNRIYHIETTMHYRHIAIGVEFFQTGKDVEDMKRGLECDNPLYKIKYDNIIEVANNSELIGFIKEAQADRVAMEPMPNTNRHSMFKDKGWDGWIFQK
jgi:hypothetical protein